MWIYLYFNFGWGENSFKTWSVQYSFTCWSLTRLTVRNDHHWCYFNFCKKALSPDSFTMAIGTVLSQLEKSYYKWHCHITNGIVILQLALSNCNWHCHITIGTVLLQLGNQGKDQSHMEPENLYTEKLRDIFWFETISLGVQFWALEQFCSFRSDLAF